MWQRVLREPERFTDHATHAISRHGIANGARCDRKAEALVDDERALDRAAQA